MRSADELMGRVAMRLHRWLRWQFEEVRNDLRRSQSVGPVLPEGHKRVYVPVMTPSGFGRVLVQGHAESFDQFFEKLRERRRHAGEVLDASLPAPPEAPDAST